MMKSTLEKLNDIGGKIMAYRNGTYIAFHAGGITDPTASDIKYYNIMKAWNASNSIDFTFVNSHDKTAGVRDSSKRATLERRIKERLNNSKHLVLILTSITKNDTDWVPLQIQYAVDDCDLPIIATYPDYRVVLHPHQLSDYWPLALESRIGNANANVIHIPFAKEPLLDAIGQFSVHTNKLNGPNIYYTSDTHRRWGLLNTYEQERNYLN